MNTKISFLISPILYYIFISALTIATSCQQNAQPLPEVSQGSIDRIENFQSQFVPSRTIDVWMPGNYSKDSSYTVLYMHDGQMLFDSTITWNKQEWGVDEVMDSLIQHSRISPCIVVGIHNGGKGRHTEYFPQKPFEKLKKTLLENKRWQGDKHLRKKIQEFESESDAYLKFLVEELKPHIDEKYPSLSNKENTFIAGSSMGGLISMYALCEYPDIFGGAACLSTHWPGLHIEEGYNPIPGSFVDYLRHQLPEPGSNKIYFDFGTETLDSLYAPYQQMVDAAMIMKGYRASDWITRKFEGADHSERSWHKRLHIPVEFLMGPE